MDGNVKKLNIQTLLQKSIIKTTGKELRNTDEGYVIDTAENAEKYLKQNKNYVTEAYFLSKLEPNGREYVMFRFSKCKPQKIKYGYYRGPTTVFNPVDLDAKIENKEIYNEYKDRFGDAAKTPLVHIKTDFKRKYDSLPGPQRRYFRKIEQWNNENIIPETNHYMIFGETEDIENLPDPYMYTKESKIIKKVLNDDDHQNKSALCSLDEVAEIYEINTRQRYNSEKIETRKPVPGDILINIEDPAEFCIMNVDETCDDFNDCPYIVIHPEDNKYADFIRVYFGSNLMEELNDWSLKTVSENKLLDCIRNSRIYKPGKANNYYHKLAMVKDSSDIKYAFLAKDSVSLKTSPNSLDDILKNEMLVRLSNTIYAFSQNMIESDFNEMIDSFNNNNFKCCTTMAGSILETICMDWLYEQKSVPSLFEKLCKYHPKCNENPSLSDIIEAFDENDFPRGMKRKAHKIRELRNLIHPRNAAMNGAPSKTDCITSINNLYQIIDLRFVSNNLNHIENPNS